MSVHHVLHDLQEKPAGGRSYYLCTKINANAPKSMQMHQNQCSTFSRTENQSYIIKREGAQPLRIYKIKNKVFTESINLCILMSTHPVSNMCVRKNNIGIILITLQLI